MDEAQSPPAFSVRQIKTLQSFADNLEVGGHAFKMVAWLFGFISAMTAFLYYIAGIRQGWHGPGGAK
jgi:hypothetical protein